ncbi:hypothetical protein [Bradyrhizobium iriomotense]|uniref:hypothetical protein n=1 Tax=Bradyrhizobium iriomotense TaxID=441950 RepID=UPI001B8A2A65|nr:hypothetical protein [Bradyrhizobium iriomotense]MBR1132916.1 hypothetical protein [Bradyrhizobium iriomotense]
MPRSSRPKPDDLMQVCFGIDTRTFEIVRIWEKRDGSYSIGGHTYGNQHRHPVETEVELIHAYISELICVPFHSFNTAITEDIQADLKAKAEKMKAAGGAITGNA